MRTLTIYPSAADHLPVCHTWRDAASQSVGALMAEAPWHEQVSGFQAHMTVDGRLRAEGRVFIQERPHYIQMFMTPQLHTEPAQTVAETAAARSAQGAGGSAAASSSAQSSGRREQKEPEHKVNELRQRAGSSRNLLQVGGARQQSTSAAAASSAVQHHDDAVLQSAIDDAVGANDATLRAAHERELRRQQQVFLNSIVAATRHGDMIARDMLGQAGIVEMTSYTPTSSPRLSAQARVVSAVPSSPLFTMADLGLGSRMQVATGPGAAVSSQVSASSMIMSASQQSSGALAAAAASASSGSALAAPAASFAAASSSSSASATVVPGIPDVPLRVMGALGESGNAEIAFLRLRAGLPALPPGGDWERWASWRGPRSNGLSYSPAETEQEYQMRCVRTAQTYENRMAQWREAAPFPREHTRLISIYGATSKQKPPRMHRPLYDEYPTWVRSDCQERQCSMWSEHRATRVPTLKEGFCMQANCECCAPIDGARWCGCRKAQGYTEDSRFCARCWEVFFQTRIPREGDAPNQSFQGRGKWQ